MAFAMEEQLLQKLASFTRQGRVILFTGAGFSLDAKTKSGDALPTVDGLATKLWEIAFPGEEFDNSSLGDVYEAAVKQASRKTQDCLRDQLTVDPNSLGDNYGLWFSFPWHRIYTLNIDDLDQAIERAVELPRPLLSLSALTDALPPPEQEALQVVHLNGTLGDLPDVTFSSRQYGERMARADLWYANLVRDLQTHPVLYVGTSLDEPPLWAYIEARGGRKTEREMRPGSFLVSPELSRARRVSLSSYNVSWVQASTAEFGSDVLAHLADEADAGQLAIEHRHKLEGGGPAVLRVSDLQNDSQDDEREFLRGREPRWSDLVSGFAIERSFDDELATEYTDSTERLVIVTGTAGSGKSTSAMRLALQQSAAGHEVFVLNRDHSGSLYSLRQAVRATEIDLLFVDDAARFGESTVGFLRDLLEDNPSMRVLACIRSSRHHTLTELSDIGHGILEKTVPLLEDSDVEGLLDALDKANRLGQLKGRTRKQQREVMQKTFGRQLLVALLEVTQGVRFEQKIESECRDLEGDAPLVYAVVALATYAGGPLTDQEVIVASGEAASAMEQIDQLVGRHLLIRNSSDRLLLRHGVIAERVVRYYQEQGIIAQICTALVIGLSSGARIGELRASRAGRTLIRLLNHEYLIKLVYRGVDAAGDSAAIRSIYDAVESLLNGDYHYWLQRGSFETEDGDLDLAKNFLDQARGMAADDLNVRTQWSYMTLKRASRCAADAGAAEEAGRAFNELEDVIASHGARGYYAFHIYGSQGLAWVHRAPLSYEEKRKLLEKLRRVVNDGIKEHPANNYLKELKVDLDREYMMLAVKT